MFLPMLSFKYRPVEQVDDIDELFKIGEEARDILNDRYVLVAAQDNMVHVVHIHEILESDIEKCTDDYICTRWKEARQSNSKDVINTIIAKNPNNIMRKIKDAIDFAMYLYEHGFGSDKLTIKYHKYFGSVTSIPNIIYQVAQEHFDIIDQSVFDQNQYLVIKKRSVDT